MEGKQPEPEVLSPAAAFSPQLQLVAALLFAVFLVASTSIACLSSEGAFNKEQFQSFLRVESRQNVEML